MEYRALLIEYTALFMEHRLFKSVVEGDLANVREDRIGFLEQDGIWGPYDTIGLFS